MAHDFDPREREIVARMVHAAADFSIASFAKFKDNFVEAALDAIQNGCKIVVDTSMAAAGISKSYADTLGIMVEVIPKPGLVPSNTTRLAAGLRDYADNLWDSILVVGNAPTVIMELEKIYKEKRILPKALVAVPVGFVGTVKAKRIAEKLPVPSLIVMGNRGGTPLAVAAVNALLRLAVHGIR